MYYVIYIYIMWIPVGGGGGTWGGRFSSLFSGVATDDQLKSLDDMLKDRCLGQDECVGNIEGGGGGPHQLSG